MGDIPETISNNTYQLDMPRPRVRALSELSMGEAFRVMSAVNEVVKSHPDDYSYFKMPASWKVLRDLKRECTSAAVLATVDALDDDYFVR